MRKYISLMMTVLMIVSMMTSLPAAAASDFTVEDGVLLRYTGSAASVNVPDGVYAIGDGAFEGNTAVKTVNLPSTVYTVGNRAFYHCSSLTTVTGSAVTSVGVFAFNDTPYFEHSTAEFFTLGSCLLWYNGTEARVTLPEGIVSIAPFAFLRYEGLTAFSAPSGLVSVGEGAFYECKALSSVSLPATVSYIGASAFDRTAYLSRATGFVTLGDGILIRYAGTETAVTVPSGVRRIAAGAFSGNQTVITLSIPSSVYSVDGGACEGCTNLTTLSLSRGLVYIGERAFSGCSALSEVATPSSLSYIGESAFEGSGVERARLNGTKLMIAANAFKNCTKLRCALLSSGVYALEDGAFGGCAALQGVSVSPDTMVISARAFDRGGSFTVYCTEKSYVASPVFGYTVSCTKGDSDGDGKMTILDATRIQRYLAGLNTFETRELCVSDVDFDAGVTILDVTRIQRILAGLA